MGNSCRPMRLSLGSKSSMPSWAFDITVMAMFCHVSVAVQADYLRRFSSSFFLLTLGLTCTSQVTLRQLLICLRCFWNGTLDILNSQFQRIFDAHMITESRGRLTKNRPRSLSLSTRFSSLSPTEVNKCGRSGNRSGFATICRLMPIDVNAVNL